MLSLALETSGRVGSVALMRDGVILVERSYPHGLMHAAAIVPLIDALFREQNVLPGDAREIYISAGPGSFTGLRVGVTLAKTLSYATGARIVSVPSVRVLAENAPPNARHVAIVLDAKRGQIFTATYSRDGAGLWSEQTHVRLDRLADVVARSPRPLHLLGDGIPFHIASVVSTPEVFCTDESAWLGKASIVAHLGAAMARRGEFTETFALSPTYIRLAEAEEKRLLAASLTHSTRSNGL